MTKLHDVEWGYDNVFPSSCWKLGDYEEFFKYVSAGYLVQITGAGFEINEEWEGEPMWEGEDEAEDEEDDKMECPECNKKFNCDEFEYIPSLSDEGTCQLGRDVCLECLKDLEHFGYVENIGKAFCEVGEHFVETEYMWENFDDCMGCVSEKEYLEAKGE
jgi:hypothetical protein